MDVILVGAPGVGKGTQATVLEERTGLTHVASGDLFRMHVAEQTDLGRKAREYMDRGELVPDDLVVGMVLERIAAPDCARGVLFDGFPRTIGQARILLAELGRAGRTVHAVVVLAAPRDVLLRRLVGRQTCKNCGATFNIFYSPSLVEAECDRCGGELYTRSDDTWATARHRLDVYLEQTLPIVAFFEERGLVHQIDGLGEVDEVNRRITTALGLHPVG